MRTTPPRVLVLRPDAQAGELIRRLQAAGFAPVVVPAIAIAPPASFADLDAALRALDRYRWVVFTSANGVRAFFARRAALGLPPPPPSVRWAVIGPGTQRALAACGIAGAWRPSRFLSDALAAELPVAPGDRVLRVRAELAATAVADRLRGRGAAVDDVVAYRTVEGPPASVPLLRAAWADGIDAVVFTSASTVRGFRALLEQAGLSLAADQVALVAIGPVTAQAARAAGWPVGRVAAEHSLDGLVRALTEGGPADVARLARS